MRPVSRRTTFGLAAAGLLAGAGCGSDADRGVGPNGEVILTMLTHYGTEPMKSGLQRMVDKWNQENPKIQVHTQAVNFDDLLATVTVRQAGGRGADIMNLYALWGGQLQQSRVLADVPGAAAHDIRGNYSKAAVNAVSLNGTLFGYPTEVETYVLFYNKKIFAQAGIKRPPRSWDELYDYAKKMARRDSKGNTLVDGIALLQGGDNQSVHPYLSLLNSVGGTFLEPNGKKVAFGSDAGRETLQLEANLANAQLSDPAIEATKAFPSNQQAMAIQAGWWIGSLKSTMGKEYANVGTAPVPGKKPGTKGSLAYAYFLCVNSRCRHPQQAWQFLSWLNSYKESNGVSGMGNFLNSQGILPGRTADTKLLNAAKKDPNFKPLQDALGFAMPELSVPQAWEAKSALHENIMSVLTRQKSVDSALSKAVSSADAALEQ